MKLNCYLRPSKTDLKPIYLFVSLKGRDKIHSGFSVKESHWDKKRMRVKNSVSGSDIINASLDRLEEKVRQIYATGTHFTAKEIIKQYQEGIELKAAIPTQLPFLQAWERFISESVSGERRTRKGKRIKDITIRQYNNTLNLLIKYILEVDHRLSWNTLDLKFYNKFTDYCWDVLDHYDNRVGTTIKNIITFLNWAVEEDIIKQKYYNSKWIKWTEDIDILVFYPDELTSLISIDFPTKSLEKIRDTFIMGCITCFRVSNLLSLRQYNLVENGDNMAIRIISVKTGQPIFINLNEVGKAIIKKYKDQYETLLPTVSAPFFNRELKVLAKYFKKHILEGNLDKKEGFIGNNWMKPFTRIRFKRGEPIYTTVDISEMVSSHTMRRTGITSLFMLGLSEVEVKEISGHSFGSKEIRKYEKIARQFVDRKASNAWSIILGQKS